MGIVLPKTKLPPETQDPQNLILFGQPKVGKSTVIAQLDNCLLLDFEKGSKYIDALKVPINSLQDLSETCKAIREAGCPYKFIAIDTITSVEDFAKPLALKLFKASPQGSKSDIDDVLKAPMGAGHAFLREAIEKIISMVQSVCENVILIGHVKDTMVGVDGEDGNVKDLDLVGKLKRILSAKSDAIGFVYRDEKSNLCINFGSNGEIMCGARPQHLANQRIVVAEQQEDGTFISHWNRIYPSLNK
jgi:hypothetical protein